MGELETKFRGPRIFTKVFIVIMIAIFITNLIISTQCNRFWVAISGGGYITDYLQLAKDAIYVKGQFYRLITYGYLQASVIHLLANIIALWYIGGFFEEFIGRLRFFLVFASGLIIPGMLLLVIYPNAHIYGVSPAIYAFIGVLVNWIFRRKELWQILKRQKGCGFIAGYFILGNIPGICTFVFHMLGFISGLLIGFVIKYELEENIDNVCEE